MTSTAALLQRLESLQRAGLQMLPKGTAFELEVVETPSADRPPQVDRREPPAELPQPQPAPTRTLGDSPRSTPAPVKAISAGQLSSPMLPSEGSLIRIPFPADLPDDIAGRESMLAELQKKVAACRLCDELACTRKQTVFGVGNARPRVVFFGEAPGADEDRQGEPFVGAAGQLLTKIIKACTWERADVYILNVLKCRPPGNRNPDPTETANCRPFFERQLEILRPEYIVCVGVVPAQALLETTMSVGKMRGRFYQYRGAQVVVTYHPSYLLRNPDAKKFVWEDMQMLLKDMGIELPGK